MSLSIEEFDSDALDVLGFRSFVRTIGDFDFPIRILVFKDEEARDVYMVRQEVGAVDSGVAIFFGEPTEVLPGIEEYERDHGLDAGARCVSFSTVGTGPNGYSSTLYPICLADCHWPVSKDLKSELGRGPLNLLAVQSIEISYPVPAPFQGIAFEEVGYQRKGMSGAFYREFQNCRAYVRISDVQRASQFLDLIGDPGNDREREEHFRTQFLDGFEEGRSIFYTSW